MGKKDKCPRCVQKVASWMATFSDMSTLLLTFFVLLLTMITEGIPSKDVSTVANAFQGGIGSGGGQTLQKGKMADMGMTIESLPSNSRGTSMGKAEHEAQLALKVELKNQQVDIVQTKSGFAVDLIGTLYYKPGTYEISPEGKKTLSKIVHLINILKEISVDNTIRVKGFADGGLISPNSTYYIHNLELTTKRANNVIYYFINEGIDPRRTYKGRNYAKFQSIGYGEFQPQEENITPEGRAYNRKVEIEFLRDPDAY